MDTHDVSKVSTYFPYLRNHRQTLQHAQSRKGQRPKTTKSRDELIMQFMFRQMMSNNTPVGRNAIRSSFVPPAYTPCVTALSDLRKVMIKDLTLENHHRGSYLLVRAVTPTDTMTAVMVIVEDEEADVLMLQLYNQEKGLVADGRLVEGTVVIVKEPYLKVMSDGDYGLRVDHLSDVTFVPGHDPRVPPSWRQQLTENDASSNSWKTNGNNHFNKASYHLAIDCYSQALHSSPTVDEALTIKLNRALSFLRSHQFEAALRDLEMALSGSKPSEKALFRKSQALYHLQRFPESCKTHQVLSKEYPGNTTAKSEFSRANARLAEQQSGKYQFKRLQLEAKRRNPPLLDHATYIGPVAVKPTEYWGRGLFTTNAVKAGGLLFCEKAFAHAFHDSNDSSQSLAILINAQKDTMTMGTQADLISLIAQKLYKNPSLMSTFTDLYHGAYKPVTVLEVDNAPVVDTFLIERIMALNCFGCPLSSREAHIRGMRQTQSDTDKQFNSCGVWALASYINHSCYSNARRAFIGDMMIVRAARDLPANTEITFSYKSPLNNVSKEKPVDHRHWGFKCSCIICQDLLATANSTLTKRKTLMVNVHKAFKPRKPDSAKIESILSTLEETYRQPASEVPRFGIWNAYLTLAMLHESRGQSQKAVEFTLKALESLGYIVEGGHLPHKPGTPLRVKKWGLMTDELVRCWMALSNAYLDAAPDLMAQAAGYARLTYRICVGEDETFGDTYSHLSQRVDGFLSTAK
ncbi:hypothetical protein BDW59DRAFT_180299 [Aspergillus cavernicola]|uniref:SET domain-containing protein n=1 Tax=Aspergillus cavernicola TaxID=176166 RepID=A0ABR4I8Y5_9EURO